MPDVVSDHADARAASGAPLTPSLTAPAPDTDDPARHVGEIFRRLTLASDTFPPQAFAREVTRVLLALGTSVLEEAERQAVRLRERTAPARPGVRVSATARRVDFDGWDPGERD